MAKVIIMIEDQPDQTVSVSVEFDPHIDKDSKVTPAQHYAWHLIESIKQVLTNMKNVRLAVNRRSMNASYENKKI